MDKEFIKQKSKFMFRTLQILCLNFEKKMDEVMLQSNRCPECNGTNILYPVNTPRSNIHSFGDSTNFFTCNGLVYWTATCLDCGRKIPIHSSYDYDVKRGSEVNSGDFFRDDNGNYGHSSRT